jgi:hypothetical protein
MMCVPLQLRVGENKMSRIKLSIIWQADLRLTRFTPITNRIISLSKCSVLFLNLTLQAYFMLTWVFYVRLWCHSYLYLANVFGLFNDKNICFLFENTPNGCLYILKTY